MRWMCAAALVLAGCSPMLDWREMRPEGSRAQMMFPCRPASHARAVALAGATVEMSMFACSAGAATYALSFADLGDPALVTPALAELGAALPANVRAAAPAASQPLAVPGMTPNALAARWRIDGRLPDGRAVQEQAALFAHGTRVYQAAIVAPTLDPQAAEVFFSALRVGP
jgi:hypothetical protein